MEWTVLEEMTQVMTMRVWVWFVGVLVLFLGGFVIGYGCGQSDERKLREGKIASFINTSTTDIVRDYMDNRRSRN